MTIRTINLGVRRHYGEATGVTFYIAPLIPQLYIGEIYVVNDPALSAVTGEIDDGTATDDPGRADLRVNPHRFADLLVLAAQPNTVKLVVTLRYDDATTPKTVVDITCRKVAPGVVVTAQTLGNGSSLD